MLRLSEISHYLSDAKIVILKFICYTDLFLTTYLVNIMVDETRRNLDKVTGELLESFIAFDKQKALHFQTGLHAIHDAQKDIESSSKTNLHAVYDEEKLHKLLAEHGISEEDFSKVPNIMKNFEDGKSDAYETLRQLPELLQEAIRKVNEKSHTLYEIPAWGMIAVTLNLVSKDIKNALIAGQAGERTLQVVERVNKHKPGLISLFNRSSILNDRLYDFGSESRLARPDIDMFVSEPQYLVSARATNHLADLLEGMVMLDPEIAGDKNAVNASRSLKCLAVDTFLHSSNILKKLGENDASNKIATLANQLLKDKEMLRAEAISTLRSSLTSIGHDMQKRNSISQKEASDYEKLIEKRFVQMEQA